MWRVHYFIRWQQSDICSLNSFNGIRTLSPPHFSKLWARSPSRAHPRAPWPCLRRPRARSRGAALSRPGSWPPPSQCGSWARRRGWWGWPAETRISHGSCWCWRCWDRWRVSPGTRWGSSGRTGHLWLGCRTRLWRPAGLSSPHTFGPPSAGPSAAGMHSTGCLLFYAWVETGCQFTSGNMARRLKSCNRIEFMSEIQRNNANVAKSV